MGPQRNNKNLVSKVEQFIQVQDGALLIVEHMSD